MGPDQNNTRNRFSIYLLSLTVNFCCQIIYTVRSKVKIPPSGTPPEEAEIIKQEKVFLEDTTWKLESCGDKDNQQTVIEDTGITIEFKSKENKFSGSAGCNGYFGSYETDKSELTIIPPIGSTVMACPEPEGVMEQEQQYLKTLQAAESFQLQDGKLQITCGAQILVFAVQEG